MFKLALIQMQVVPGDKARNIAHAEALIAQAAAGGAACVLLPEVMDLGWTHPSALTEAEPIPNGEPCQRLVSAARRFGIHVCGGMVERDGDNIYNSAVLIDPTGEVILKHRKLNELEIAHSLYAQGDRLNVVDTPLGRIGLMICADGFAKDQVIARSLGYMGAQIILSPSSWAREADHDNTKDPYGTIWRESYIPVARDFSLWIASTSNVGWISDGPWQGRKCVGCSMVVDPSGKVIAQGSYGPDAEAILYVNIEPIERHVRGCGWARIWDVEQVEWHPK